MSRRKWKDGQSVQLARSSPHYGQHAGVGKIKNWDGSDEYTVVWPDKYENSYEEMELEDPMEGLSVTKGVVLRYQPGTSVSDFVKKLLKLEKNKDRVKWLRSFDQCVLPKHVKDTMDEALTVVLRADVFEKWGINDNFEKGVTNAILIYGPPGTGKTMVCESIAAILGKNLMKMSSSDIQSNVPGQTERNIIESFKKAKSMDCVIMFDECDSVLADRNTVGTILAAEINCLLQEIERFDGVVVLTTNRLHHLDPALARRIIAKVELPAPSEEARREIWRRLIPQRMPVKSIDHNKLAKSNLTGGEIKNAILLAARKAIAKNHKCVTMEHFEEAVILVEKAKRDFDACHGFHGVHGDDMDIDKIADQMRKIMG